MSDPFPLIEARQSIKQNNPIAQRNTLKSRAAGTGGEQQKVDESRDCARVLDSWARKASAT